MTDNNENINVSENMEAEIKAEQGDKPQAPKEGKAKPQKLKSAYTLKYGSYATATVAIVIAVVLALNVFLNVLNERFPMTLDFTAANEYTFNEENIEFLKDIDYKVELSVIFSENDYKDFNNLYNYRGIHDTTGGSYLNQTVELLKQYKKYNKNISVRFLDPFASSSEGASGVDVTSIVSEFTEHDLMVNFGDILIKCWPDGEDGEPKRGLVSAEDCYALTSESEGAMDYYNTGTAIKTISANSVENAVANGIFKTVNLKTVKAAVITANSSETFVEYLKEVAKLNAFEFATVNMIMDTDLSQFDVMIICAPGADYTSKECTAISEWLDNNGKKGKTLLYFASPASPELPRLHALLEEWGISYERGYKYYSTDELYYSNSKTNIRLQTMGTDYTSTVNTGSYAFIANNMVPISAIYETEVNGNRTVETIMQTEDNSVYKKPDGDKTWKPAGGGDLRPVILLSKDAGKKASSYVIGVASVDFITNSDVITKSDNGNLRAIINMLNTTSRDNEDEYVMQGKLVSDTSGMFVNSTTEAQTLLIAVVFLGVIPISLIAIAIFVFRKRKNL